jgi:hypothetical protein
MNCVKVELGSFTIEWIQRKISTRNPSLKTFWIAQFTQFFSLGKSLDDTIDLVLNEFHSN